MSRVARNFVHNDEIWKDHVRRERQSFTRRWPERWGHLTDEYRKMNRELQGLPPEECPQATQVTKLPPLSQGKPGQKTTKLPVTTAQLMGWHMTRSKAMPLEIYGRHARGQLGLLKRLNWPAQGVE